MLVCCYFSECVNNNGNIIICVSPASPAFPGVRGCPSLCPSWVNMPCHRTFTAPCEVEYIYLSVVAWKRSR